MQVNSARESIESKEASLCEGENAQNANSTRVETDQTAGSGNREIVESQQCKNGICAIVWKPRRIVAA